MFDAKKNKGKMKPIEIVMLIVLMLAVAIGGFFYFRDMRNLKKGRFELRFSYEEKSDTYTLKKVGMFGESKVSIEIPSEYSDGTHGGRSVAKIAENAFSDEMRSEQLESVIIPDSVTTIESGAFKNCAGLKKVSIGSNVVNCGNGVFNGCDALQYTESNNGLYLGNKNNPHVIFMKVKDKDSGIFDINENTHIIYDKAFYDCNLLESIAIPSKVTSIGSFAFSGCNLKEVAIGDNLTSIGYEAFYKQENLRSIDFAGDVAAWHAIRGISSLTRASDAHTLWLKGEKAYSVEIPAGTTEIKDYAFYGCVNLTSVTIPESVVEIGREAFKNCYKLVEVINKSELDIYKNGKTNGSVGEYALIVENQGESKIYRQDDFVFFNYYGNICLVEYLGKEPTIELPDNYSGYNYDIYKYAFADCINATEIFVAENTVSIYPGAFRHCDNLESLSLPFVGGSRDESYFSQKVFGYIFGYEVITGGSNPSKEYLEELGLQDAVVQYRKSIGSNEDEYYYYHIPKKISKVIIQESATFIDGEAFNNCYGITDVIWNAVNCNSAIPEHAVRVTIGEDVEKIPLLPSSCKEVHIKNFAKWCSYDFDTASFRALSNVENVFVDGEVVTDIIVPQDISHIGNYAFCGYKKLKSIIMSDGVKSIGESAFYGCENLESVSYNNDVNEIGNSAFENCSKLQNVVLPESVESIGNSAFRGCSGIDKIFIPDNVKTIGAYAFGNCVAISDLSLGENITEIGYSAFEGCINLISLTIPQRVESIDFSAFAGCGGITNLTWNAVNCTVEKSASSIFKDCAALKNVVVAADVQSIPKEIFSECNIEYAEIPTKAIECLPKASLKTVVINGGETIGEKGNFYNFENLETATIAEGIKTIGDNSFEGCSKLTSVTIPNGVTIIGEDAFRNCSSLKSIDIPDTVETIGVRVFENCTALISIEIGKGCTSIDSHAFSGCKHLTSVTIPKNVKSLGSGAFYGCWQLKNIKFECKIKRIEPNTFLNCYALKSIIIPDSVIFIGEDAFSNCRSLEEITIGSGVGFIRGTAFEGCVKLTRAKFKNTNGWDLWTEVHINYNTSRYEHEKYLQDVVVEDAEMMAKKLKAYTGYTIYTDKRYNQQFAKYYEWRRDNAKCNADTQ